MSKRKHPPAASATTPTPVLYSSSDPAGAGAPASALPAGSPVSPSLPTNIISAPPTLSTSVKQRKATPRKKHKEKYYEDKLKAWLKHRGAWYIKYWGGGVYTRAGVPDLLVCYRGRFIAIEVKGEHGRISDAQRAEMAQIEAAGGIGIFYFPGMENAVDRIFDMIDAGLEPPQHTEPERKRGRKST